MGSFMGHAAPGTFFFIFGAWWAFAAIRRFLLSRRDGTAFVSTPTFDLSPDSSRPSRLSSANEAKNLKAFLFRLPLEGVVKVVFSTLGMTIEIGGHLPPPIPMRIIQHTTMYGFFFVSGLVDMMVYLDAPLPDGAQYGSMALALTAEGLLFASHVHGREILDIHIHMLLVKVIGSSVVVLLLEARHRGHPLLPLGRAFLFMLQGTWFWAVAVILYKNGKAPTDWDLDSPESVMLATIYFSWHLASILIGLLVLSVSMSYCCYRLRGKSASHGLPDSIPINKTDDHSQYNILSTDDDDDGDESYKLKPRDFEI